MKFRIIFSLVLVLGFTSLIGQTYQKLSTLERSSVPNMIPLTKPVSGQNIMVYALLDSTVNGAIDTTYVVTYSVFNDSLQALEARLLWLGQRLENGAVSINAVSSFSIDSLSLLNYIARRPAGSSRSQIILSSSTSVPAQLINSNAAGDTTNQAKLQLDFDATSFLEGLIVEMRAKGAGATAKLNLQDTVLTAYGTLVLNNYQSPFDYLGSPAALLGTDGLGRVWSVDPSTIAGGNGIFGVSDTVPFGLVATLSDGEDDFSLVFNWSDGASAFGFTENAGSKTIDLGATNMALTVTNNIDLSATGVVNIGEGELELQNPGIGSTLLTSGATSINVGLKLPATAGSAGNILTLTAPGVSAWQAPSAGENIYNSDGSIPSAVNRIATIPTNSTLLFQTTGSQHEFGYKTDWGSSENITGVGGEYYSGTVRSQYFAGNVTGSNQSGIFTQSNSALGGVFNVQTSSYLQFKNPVTNSGSMFLAQSNRATLGYQFAGSSFTTAIEVGNGFINAYGTDNNSTVDYPFERPLSNSFWQYNTNGTGTYIATSSFGNGVYGGSGIIPNSTAATMLNGVFSIATAGGNGLYFGAVEGIYIGQTANNRFAVNSLSNFYTFGNSGGATGDATLRLYNNEGDLVSIRPPSSGLTSYTIVLPANGDGSPAGSLLTNTGGGVTTWALPVVYLSLLHTNYQEVTVTADSYDAIVVSPDLDGYTVVSATYRTQSVVSGTGNIGVELVRTSEGGTVTTGFLDDEIANGNRLVNATGNPMLLSTGDTITGLATLGTATAEGLTITLKLTK